MAAATQDILPAGVAEQTIAVLWDEHSRRFGRQPLPHRDIGCSRFTGHHDGKQAGSAHIPWHVNRHHIETSSTAVLRAPPMSSRPDQHRLLPAPLVSAATAPLTRSTVVLPLRSHPELSMHKLAHSTCRTTQPNHSASKHVSSFSAASIPADLYPSVVRFDFSEHRHRNSGVHSTPPAHTRPY